MIPCGTRITHGVACVDELCQEAVGIAVHTSVAFIVIIMIIIMIAIIALVVSGTICILITDPVTSWPLLLLPFLLLPLLLMM